MPQAHEHGDRAERPRVTFVYLGRSPAFGNFVTEFAAATSGRGAADSDFVVAGGTALAEHLARIGVPVSAVPTFQSASLRHVAVGYVRASRQIVGQLARRRPHAVVTLMPHIWSPLISPQIRRLGLPYATIIHDAEPHPGDPTAWATRWLARDARHADVVFTLSRAVAQRLCANRAGRDARIVPMFHPDLGAGARPIERRRDPSRPLKVLFFGRILAYKGLALLIEAVELLQRDGIAIELGIAGVGALEPHMRRLVRLGAEIVNRWLTPDEVRDLLARYDVMACSHVEASQSGVAALAFGNTMPVVATPVGGVTEQVITGKTGLLARDVSARALADAIAELARNPALYAEIHAYLAATRTERSMETFLAGMLSALDLGPAAAASRIP